MRLNNRTVAELRLPEGKREHTEYDDDLPGFGLRIRASGGKRYVVVYRHEGSVRRIVLGNPTAVRAEDAREAARRILAQADLGEDTAARRQAERERAGFTLRALIDAYVARHVEVRQRPRTQLETKRHLEQHWAPLHSTPVHRVGRRQIADRLNELATQNGGVAANRARAALSAMFTWGMRAGLVEAEVNPVSGTARPAVESARARVLTVEELRAVWKATEGLGDYNAIVRLLMLTGQRREEIGAMAWTEIEIAPAGSAVWRIPADRAKNGRAHDVPLSSSALVVLAGLPKRENRDLVFGRRSGPFSGWSRAKAGLDRRIAEQRASAAGRSKPTTQDAIAHWTLHDLRRSADTYMAEMGIEPHVIEAVINHAGGHRAGVAGVYNRATYAEQKRIALNRWAVWMMEQFGESPAGEAEEGGDVISLDMAQQA